MSYASSYPCTHNFYFLSDPDYFLSVPRSLATSLLTGELAAFALMNTSCRSSLLGLRLV